MAFTDQTAWFISAGQEWAVHTLLRDIQPRLPVSRPA